MKAAILARVSTEQQSGPLKHSISTQGELLREMAERRGWEVVRVFEIPGESAYADEMAARPMFEAAVEAACRREFDVLLISEFSRFARSQRVAHDVLWRMRKAGCALVALNGVDYTADNDHASIEAWMANRASRDHAFRVSNGHRGTYERGMLIGDIPFGYRRVMSADARGAIVPNTSLPVEVVPEEAEAIRWAFDAYVHRASLREIADELNRRGMRPRSKRGLLLFETSSVQSLLENRAYAGWVSYKGETKPGAHEAIVPLEVWAAAQARVERKIRSPKSTNLLSGLIACTHCRTPLTSEGLRRRYVERRKRNNECAMAGRSVSMEVAHRDIEAAVSAMSLENETEWAEYVTRGARRPAAEGRGERERLEEERRRAAKAYQLGALTDAELATAMEEIRRRQARLAPDVGALRYAAQRVSSFAQLWGGATEEEKNEALRIILDGVEVDVASGSVWLRPHRDFAGLASARSEFVASRYLFTPDWNRTTVDSRTPAQPYSRIDGSGLYLPSELVGAA